MTFQKNRLLLCLTLSLSCFMTPLMGMDRYPILPPFELIKKVISLGKTLTNTRTRRLITGATFTVGMIVLLYKLNKYRNQGTISGSSSSKPAPARSSGSSSSSRTSRIPARPLTHREKNDLLYAAAREGNLADVKRLVEQGANVNYIEPTINSTPLRIASSQGHFEVFCYLLSKGALITKRGEYTILSLSNNPHITQLLLELGENPHATSKTIPDVGLLINRSEPPKNVELFLQYGASLNTRYSFCHDAEHDHGMWCNPRIQTHVANALIAYQNILDLIPRVRAEIESLQNAISPYAPPEVTEPLQKQLESRQKLHRELNESFNNHIPLMYLLLCNGADVAPSMIDLAQNESVKAMIADCCTHQSQTEDATEYTHSPVIKTLSKTGIPVSGKKVIDLTQLQHQDDQRPRNIFRQLQSREMGGVKRHRPGRHFTPEDETVIKFFKKPEESKEEI
jgi:ankyrin repeat protein